jgi:death-on-curing protein
MVPDLTPLEIHFFELEQVIETHELQLKEHGGGKAGIQNIELLESAISQPQSGAFGVYFHADLYEMAAAYLYHIAKNHAFLDGNKRTGLAVALDFIEFHNISIEAANEELVGLTLKVIEKGLTPLEAKQIATDFFRQHTVMPISGE